MKWPPLLLFIGWLAVFPSEMRAKEPGGPPAAPSSKPSAPDSLPRPSLLRQNQAAHFHLILGRLQLDPVRYRKGSQSLVHVTVPANAADPRTQRIEPVTETLHVDCKRGIPSMQYLMTSPSARVSIDADGRGPWRIESKRTNVAGTVRVIVQQTPGSPIVLKCISDAPELSIQAATWLHLREADRAIFVEHLEPIVDELLWPYRFNELASAAQAHSLAHSTVQQDNPSLDDELISGWIDELRSPTRTVRTSAERKLRAVGIALLPRLAKLDFSSLDAEQQKRLREIESTLTPLVEDDAIRLAMLIHDDLGYWQLASHRLDDRKQQIVATRFGTPGLVKPGQVGPGQAPRIATRPVSRGR